MTWIEAGIFLLGLFFCLAAIAPSFGMKTWWMRICIYADQQLFWIIGGCLVAYIFVFPMTRPIDGAAVALATTAMLYCLKSFISSLPFMPLDKRAAVEVSNGTRASLMIANVLQTNDDYQSLLNVIRDADPDIIFLSETTDEWADALSELKQTHPHTALLPLPDFNGLLFYSRRPIRACNERRLVQDHVPSFTLDLELAPDTPLRMYALHPRPPRPEDSPDALDTEMMLVAREAQACPMPVLVAGDLNEVGWSPALKRFLIPSSLCDPREGRGIFNSYNAKFPLLRWPLDHAFYSCDIALVSLQRLGKFGSDHFPMLFTFDVPATLPAPKKEH